MNKPLVFLLLLLPSIFSSQAMQALSGGDDEDGQLLKPPFQMAGDGRVFLPVMTSKAEVEELGALMTLPPEESAAKLVEADLRAGFLNDALFVMPYVGTSACMIISNQTSRKAVFTITSEGSTVFKSVMTTRRTTLAFRLSYTPKSRFSWSSCEEEVRQIAINLPGARKPPLHFDFEPLKINAMSLYYFEFSLSGDTYTLESNVVIPKLRT